MKLFRIESDIKLDITYNIFLSCHICDCPAIISVYKYIIKLLHIFINYVPTNCKLFEFVDSYVSFENTIVKTFISKIRQYLKKTHKTNRYSNSFKETRVDPTSSVTNNNKRSMTDTKL